MKDPTRCILDSANRPFTWQEARLVVRSRVPFRAGILSSTGDLDWKVSSWHFPRVKLVQTEVATDTQLWAAIAVTLMAPRIRSCSSHHALNRQALCQQLWGTFQAADAAAPKSRPGPDLQYRRARLRFR